jgi:multimeric flavodoxin WrbA
MSAKLKALVDKSVQVHKQLTGKVGGAFTSSGGTASGGETTLMSIV